MKTALKVLGGLLLALVVLVGVGVAQAWAPDRDVDGLKARWAPPPSQFVGLMGMQVHLRDEGPRNDPQPIVLLHGTSASLHTWDGWAEALKGQRRVIRMDLPGFGLTGPMPDGNYQLTRYVEFVVALLDQLGVKQAVVAGNSFGGNLAWKLAVDHPERVGKLVLVDAAGYPYDPTSVPIGFKVAQIPWLRPVMENVLPRSMIESSVRNVYGDPAKVTPELIDRYLELTLRAGNRHALGERFRQSPGGQYAAQIPSVKQPTLILWGGQDRLIPPDNADHFQRDIAGSRLVVFDGLGHVPHEEDPAATVAAVQSFLGR
ncbi:MAG: alpha/beta hydrolase [Aquabacterium commune]|jgi:pimeloyl-ACP methyl ester carboxylesterase|uniref:alpha/beta fold hydrolase n=1 Tax=Aquabacterium TaxID=92793 RepID=UPI001DB68EAC|nr:alpha/beta hydrolase [Aquabacterium sp.]MBT9609644.1 alpha/beta hydrolase [Aquabacterium sp.]